MAEKMTRRQLRAPDKFTQTTTSWLTWAKENPKETGIAIGGAVLALLIVGFLFGGSGEIRVDPKAGGALSEALRLVDREVGEPKDGEPTFASEEEKREALIAAFTEVRASHGKSPSGLTATLALADLHLRAGNADEALALYDEFLGRAGSKNPMRALALGGKALALEAKGDRDGALGLFDELAVEFPSQAARSLYGKARILETQQKWDEARGAWQALQDEHATTSQGREAGTRLGRLNLRHPPQAAAEKEG